MKWRFQGSRGKVVFPEAAQGVPGLDSVLSAVRSERMVRHRDRSAVQDSRTAGRYMVDGGG